MKKKENIGPSVSFGPEDCGYLYTPYQMKNLEGRMYTAIESWGMKDSQEKAAKDIARDVFADFWNNVVYVNPETTHKIREEHYSRLGSGIAGSPVR